jgi:hypothetical protein
MGIVNIPQLSESVVKIVATFFETNYREPFRIVHSPVLLGHI